jgi:thymidine phosphorylase
MTTEEMLSLTRSMAEVGNRIDWPDKNNVVDKHSIGGIPGNRTSMIVVPIVAAHGLLIPKTSSRAITSPAGTADTMEVLARVDLNEHEMKAVVEGCNGCIVWGGHVNLSPADDILISVERPLNVDTPEQMVASILSKKLAAGSKNLLIDIPLGRSAKVRTHTDALRLKKLFEYVGDQLGLRVNILVTKAHEPIGRGIGPALEARDIMMVLRNDVNAPADLREKSLLLAGHLLEFDPDLRGGAGYETAKQLLTSGKALIVMENIIDAQGRNERPVKLGPLKKLVAADRSGTISAINCYRLARIARLAGAPLDKGAGIDLLKKSGDRVEKGEPLYRIHACIQSDFRYASEMADENPGYLY